MSRATQETCPASQSSFVYRALTVCGRSFQIVRLEDWFLTRRPCGRTGPYNPAVQARRFGLFRVRSPLLTESLLFSFPAGTEMVHFPALSSTAYVFSRRCPGITPGGFPHSEIFGSTLVCSLPKLIAACRVLHRLLAPRHPPYALSSLTILGNWSTAKIRSIDATGSPQSDQRPRHCVITESYRLWSIQLSNTNSGGEYRARTGDLLVANQALSQLS